MAPGTGWTSISKGCWDLRLFFLINKTCNIEKRTNHMNQKIKCRMENNELWYFEEFKHKAEKQLLNDNVLINLEIVPFPNRLGETISNLKAGKRNCPCPEELTTHCNRFHSNSLQKIGDNNERLSWIGGRQNWVYVLDTATNLGSQGIVYIHTQCNTIQVLN